MLTVNNTIYYVKNNNTTTLEENRRKFFIDKKSIINSCTKILVNSFCKVNVERLALKKKYKSAIFIHIICLFYYYYTRSKANLTPNIMFKANKFKDVMGLP